MKGFRKTVIREFKEAGYCFDRYVKHGALYKKDEHTVMIPRRIDTRKISDHTIRQIRKAL